MTPDALITTTVLMGLLVLAGGAWAVLYCIGRMRARERLVHAGIASYGVALALALVIAVDSPLDFGWKLLIVASALAYAAIPPITLRYLDRMHADHEGQP